MKKESNVYPVIFMTVVTAITVLILAFVNQSTMATRIDNKNLEERRKILYVFDKYDENQTSDEEVNQIFENEVKTETDSKGREIYILEENGEEKAYAIPFEGPGLWGEIIGYIGLNSDLEHITGVEFFKQSETPGLGGRISEAPYKEQYRGVEIGKDNSPYIINKPAPGGNIDAIAGATQTSTFVQNMINEGIDFFLQEGGAK